jgi:hypothetical protein
LCIGLRAGVTKSDCFAVDAVMLAVCRSQEPVQYPEGALFYSSLMVAGGIASG